MEHLEDQLVGRARGMVGGGFLWVSPTTRRYFARTIFVKIDGRLVDLETMRCSS
jgi:hypothetical protein